MSNGSVIDRYNEPLWDSSGFTRPNGVLEVSKQNQLTFVPNNLPPKISYDHELIELLVQAERKVGELKGMGNELENPHVLIRAHVKREAVLSSKIEGTLASLEDLNKYEAVGNIRQDVMDRLRLYEVVNYVNALEDTLKKIEKPDQPIDLAIIKSAHKTLMTGVRGEDKKPGEFRTTQNWIAKTLGTTKKIIYAPPSPERIPDLLKNFEGFLQTNQQISILIQCAVVHYQFEAIHPFLDGNGRIGRLLLSLILYKKGLMPKPLLYLSAYFDKHQQEYYNGLQNISQKSKWTEWIKFFLRAFAEQAEQTIKSIQRLVSLERKYKETLRQRNASGNAVLLSEHLFSNPYITIPQAREFLKVTYPSAKNAVMTLVDLGILEQTNIIHRSKVFVAKEIKDILNAD